MPAQRHPPLAHHRASRRAPRFGAVAAPLVTLVLACALEVVRATQHHPAQVNHGCPHVRSRRATAAL